MYFGIGILVLQLGPLVNINQTTMFFIFDTLGTSIVVYTEENLNIFCFFLKPFHHFKNYLIYHFVLYVVYSDTYKLKRKRTFEYCAENTMQSLIYI